MPRIVHLGLGAFHRAHQAWYTARAGRDWAITGVVMRNRALYDTLCAQGGAYTLAEQTQAGLSAQSIAVHDRLILAADEPDAVVRAIADPDVAVITLTITEKGYADTAPGGAVGLLVRGLARRAGHGAAPVTVMSCDNLSGNGDALQRAATAMARATDATLDPANTFPNAMVDRITPATTPETLRAIAKATGAPEDRAAVITEGFSDWVIEDRFAGPRPSWDRAGAQIVADVGPFETRKLRLLNGAHSYLAYAGLAAGHVFVHEAFADPALRADVEALWDEATATLPPPAQETAAAYRAALTARFDVPAMRHSLAQIAQDGSLKLRERIVPVALASPANRAARRALAAWLRYLEAGLPIIDPQADTLAQAMAQPIAVARAQAALSVLGLPPEIASEIAAPQ